MIRVQYLPSKTKLIKRVSAFIQVGLWRSSMRIIINAPSSVCTFTDETPKEKHKCDYYSGVWAFELKVALEEYLATESSSEEEETEVKVLLPSSPREVSAKGYTSNLIDFLQQEPNTLYLEVHTHPERVSPKIRLVLVRSPGKDPKLIPKWINDIFIALRSEAATAISISDQERGFRPFIPVSRVIIPSLYISFPDRPVEEGEIKLIRKIAKTFS